MLCCPNCFSDNFLRNQIRIDSTQRNTCEFCGSRNIEVVEATSLYDRFTPILDLYVVDSNGSDLGTIIQDDWGSFGTLSEGKILSLLFDITGDRQVAKSKYQCRIEQDKTQLERWYAFREELMHHNRYFPTLIPDREHLENLFVLLAVTFNTRLFRARINALSTPHPVEKMGMPPRGSASNGRANPKGISYLYAASGVKTAISEVRPFIGDSVTVVEFETTKSLKLVDLRNPRKTISPYELSVDNLASIYRGMPFLVLLGDELSKPVVPRDADLEYLPSQYLCEFVKHINFDGIVYRSSLTEGDNFAIFREDKLDSLSTTEYTIDAIDISYTSSR